jgi:photosystem II stability/assembly factor-like uncharacterized protein
MMIVLRWLVISLVTGLLLRGETGPVEPPRMLLLGAAEAGASLIAVGERGTILHSTNDGQSWTNRPSPTQATLTAVKFSRDGGARLGRGP